MPTPETEAAVAKLIKARERLTEITKQLNEAHASKDAGRKARQRYAKLQEFWDEALKQFEMAVQEFTAVVKRAKD